MRKDLFKADFFWPLASFSLIAMVLLLGAVFGLVRQFDLSATQREQTVVENGLMGRIEEAAQVVNTEGMWDDAVVNLDHRFDLAWAKANVSEFLFQNNGFRHAFVLNSEDQAIFAADEGNPVALAAYDDFAKSVAPLVANVRVAELARGPARTQSSLGHLVSKPIHSSAIAEVDGEFFIVSATLVQPDFGTAVPKGPRAPILVAALPMDEPFLEAFAHRFLLNNLHVHPGDTSDELDEGHVGVRDSSGRYVATLDWTPQNPGQTLLKRLIAPIMIILVCLAGIVLILYRISRRMAQGLIASEARAAHLAYYDPLTGLPNRVQFFDKLGQSLGQISRGQGAVAVLCIDLDRFKEVNDTYGHHVGDELIREAGRRMAAQCRSCDTFYRLSGDEFAIVQTQAEAKGAGALADRLVRTLAEPIQLGSGMVFAGCSVGISVLKTTVEAEEAFRQADLALYRAKANGKGQFAFFETEMDAAIKTRRALEGDLRLALAAGDLQMNYQPQVNHRDQMTGVEALIRWNHPERGMVSPAFFVPIAEECGLIGELGIFTLRRAFEDSRRWPGLRVAVNVSASQLRMKDFVPRVEALLKELNVDPFNFELEITEGLLLGDDPATHETLRRLRGIGFQLALDDFGTGYSSLSYLQRYPINKIKIDRSFISNLGWDSEAGAVVGAIVKLAKALKLQVIAEGVETDVQRDELIAVGCSDIQGFLFSRPVGAEDIERLRRVPVRQARRAAS